MTVRSRAQRIVQEARAANRVESQTIAPSRLLEKRKIGVSGSSRDVTPLMKDFSKAVGRFLVKNGDVCVVTGGTKKRDSAGDRDFAVDWYVADAARAELMAQKVDRRSFNERLMTFPRHEGSTGHEIDDSSQGFQLGDVRSVRGKTGETRRFAFVRQLDGLIAIGGGRGTDQELALAIELEIPVLPVPTFPGRGTGTPPFGARKYWDVYRDELVAKLRISPSKAKRWEKLATAAPDPVPLAGDMTSVFLRSLARRCFVITPFSDVHTPLFERVIQPAVEGLGDTPVNLKYLGFVGDAVHHVVDGIRNCDYVIAVLEEPMLNVLYELGLAHGHDKPAVLISRKAATNGKNLPFDIITQNRIEYERVDDALRKRLVADLKRMFRNR